jgi:hypothetical protein
MKSINFSRYFPYPSHPSFSGTKAAKKPALARLLYAWMENSLKSWMNIFPSKTPSSLLSERCIVGNSNIRATAKTTVLSEAFLTEAKSDPGASFGLQWKNH